MIVTSVPSLARVMLRGASLAQRIRVHWRRFWAPGASFRVVYVEDDDAREADDPRWRSN